MVQQERGAQGGLCHRDRCPVCWGIGEDQDHTGQSRVPLLEHDASHHGLRIQEATLQFKSHAQGWLDQHRVDRALIPDNWNGDLRRHPEVRWKQGLQASHDPGVGCIANRRSPGIHPHNQVEANHAGTCTEVIEIGCRLAALDPGNGCLGERRSSSDRSLAQACGTPSQSDCGAELKPRASCPSMASRSRILATPHELRVARPCVSAGDRRLIGPERARLFTRKLVHRRTPSIRPMLRRMSQPMNGPAREPSFQGDPPTYQPRRE